MRYANIFLLRFQEIFTQRSKSLIFFLKALLNPFFMLFFWKGVGRNELFFSQSFILSYYLFAVVAYALLMSTIEEEVSTNDIEHGGLSQYLLKPFPYYWVKCIEELPYRLLQGFFGITTCGILVLLFNNFFQLPANAIDYLLVFIIFFFAYFLAFTFKMIIGIVTFWIEDPQAMYHVVDATILAFSGLVVPLQFMPESLGKIAEVFPFAYIIYFPAAALTGIFTQTDLLRILMVQVIWLIVLVFFYEFLWAKGVKKYTGVGQ